MNSDSQKYHALQNPQKIILNISVMLCVMAYFALNIFTWAGSILIPVACLLLLLGFYRNIYANIKQLSMISMIFFILIIVLAMFYSPVNWHQRLFSLKHYIPLLFIPILMVLFQYKNTFSKVALHLFYFGCITYMFLSVMDFYHILPIKIWLHRVTADLYIYERANYAFALSVFLGLQYIFNTNTHIKIRIVYLLTNLFLLWALLYVSIVRTDYILTFSAIIIFTLQQLKKLHWKWFLLIVVALCFSIVSIYHFSNRVNSGINRIAYGIEAFHHGDADTSSGLRLAFTRDSLTFIKQKPILGYGTGSFSQIYAEHHFLGEDGHPTTLNTPLDQPHNQYTYLLTEQGAIGALCFIILLILIWRQSPSLPLYYRHLCQAVIILLAINSLFMSTLFYHNTTYTFCALLAICLAQHKLTHKDKN